MAGASLARVCIFDAIVQSEFCEDGLLEARPLTAGFDEIEQSRGCTVLTRADDGFAGLQIAVPLRISGGALLGALMIAIPRGASLKAPVAKALEDLAALAAFMACEWAKASDISAKPNSSEPLAHTDDLLWQLDADLHFTHCSSLSGASAEWVIGQCWADMGEIVDDPKAWQSHMADVADRKVYQDFTFDMERGGRVIRIVSSGYPTFDSDGAFDGYRGISREFEALAAPKLGMKTTRFDPVTGLMNRSAWYQCLNRLLPGDQAHTNGAALILIDIDHFKTFNQRYGHSTADDVLRAVARRLEGAIRVQDRLARVGSDEFSVIASQIDCAESASDLAERLGEEFLLPIEIGRHSIDVSVTMGVALAPQDGTTADELVASAGLAQAYAKMESRGRYRLYASTMRQQMQSRVVLDNDLQKAVAAHEFELFYQPQVRLSDNKVIGAEALIRWRHPERGLLAPGQFIDALEQSDYAVSVGNWVIQEAARKAKSWHDSGFPIRVGVNLSAGHFASFDVVNLVRDTLRETGLDPKLLEMEVTENAVLQSGHDGRELIAQLRETGVLVSFDDFGTGYGSLSDLRSIPVDRIKIDRTFIMDSLSSANDASIVRAIISLARNLGLATIAEGVEDEAQVALLRLFGCDEVQGYLYSKPVPSGAFDKLLRENAQQEAEDRMEAARLEA